MSRDRKSWWLALGLVLTLSWIQVGCASSEAEPECSTDFECAFTETCKAGVCEAAIRDSNNDSNNNGAPDATIDPTDTGIDDEPDTETPTPDTGDDVDDPTTCDPACTADQRCEDGTCVPATTDPTCTQKGEVCDPALSDQGSFWCAGDGDGNGNCLPKCSETLSANGCGLSEYCWNIGSTDQPAPACIASECQANADCDSGTCLNFDNQFGICLPSGTTPAGQSCDPNATNTCQPGLLCRSDSSGSTTGTCTTLCDLFTAPSCPTGKVCDLFTSREGVCVSDIDPTGSQPYTSCSAQGNMCDDAIPCIGFAGGTNGCMPYCRPGMGDCPAPGGTAQVVCNNYVSPGQRTWGLCLGACTDDADCGGGPCEGGICRSACAPATVVDDCCGGRTPCDWTCVNNKCE